jgi:hypothetical protein
MPTIFQRIESALQGNTLTGQIGTQAGALDTVGSALSGVIANPPAAIGGLGDSMRSLAAPNVDAGGGLAGVITSIHGAVPKDLSSVTGGLTSALSGLQGSVNDHIATNLGEMIQAIEALYQLTQLDFTGQGKTGGGGGAGAGAAGAGGGGPGAGAGAGGAGAGGAGPGGARAGAGAGGAATQPPPSASAIDAVNAILATAPSPLTVEALLTMLNQLLAGARLDNLPVRQLVIIGELRDTLGTLFRWEAAQPAAIAAELAATLQRLEAFLHTSLDPAFQPVISVSASAAGHLHADALSQIADGLVARLGEIQTAVAAGSLTGATASITAATALLDQYDALKPVLQTDLLGGLAGMESKLRALPDDLDDQMGRVASVLIPSNTLAILDAIPAPGGDPPAILTEVSKLLEAIVRWFQDLFDKINLAPVQQPIKAAADAARSAVDDLDNAMVTVTSQVQSLFGQVESLLAQVDTAAITAQVETAIQNFKTQLVQQITALVAPVKDSLTQVVTTIDQNVSAFDPAQIVDALKKAIDALAGVLQDPAVLGAVQQIQGTINQAASQLESFSFGSVTDPVIQQINQVADTLKGIDTSQLNPALQLALQAALQLIPHDLTPLTDPLVADFNKLIQEGPAPLLDAVKDQPKKLLDQAKNFEPAKLLGDAISKPYQQLLGQMGAFKPSQLLAPVSAELAQLKDRLKRNASPGIALQPLEAPFNELLAAFDQLHPEDLTKPLDDALHKVVDTVLKVVPADAVFAQVDQVLKRVHDVITIGTSFASMLGKAHDLLAGLADPKTQLDAWLASILAKLDALGDTGALGTSLAAISTDIDGLKASAITARFNAGVGPLQTPLTTLNAQGRLTAVVQAYRRIPAAAVDGLPSSPAKTQLKTMLARLDPMQPAFQAPFLALDGLLQAVTQTSGALGGALADWDSRYHAADGALAGLRNLTPTPANVKQWVHDAAEDQLVRPLGALLGLAAPLAQVLAPIAAQTQALVTALTGKLNDLLLGPNSLSGIVDALKALVQRLQALNFNFLRDSLKDLFGQVRAKLDTVNPKHLADALDKAFRDVLDTLSLGTFLPDADVKTLDDDYAKVIDKLKQLDPEVVVIKLVQPEFEQKVLPLLDAFDLTAVLHALLDALNKLSGQLKSELARVNQAFQAMLQAVPSMSPGAIAGAVAGAVGDLAGSVGISL